MLRLHPFNRVEISEKAEFGVITNGAAYQYVKEALGDKASVLKLGMVNPLPEKLIQDFAAKYEKIYVIEELDGIIEEHCRNIGVNNVQGKEIFGYIGELPQSVIAEKLLGEKKEYVELGENIPVRPPVMCAGCPHRGLFYCLKKQDNRIRRYRMLHSRCCCSAVCC